MCTIEKQIKKQRKLSNEVEYTFNSQETNSNSSFFDEERSSDFEDNNSQVEEDLQDLWEMSSICTENSSNIQILEENSKNTRSSLTVYPPQSMKRAHQEEDGVIIFADKSNNKNSYSGKGIAIDVLGQGSIGNQSKKNKKSQKLLCKQLEFNNNNNNNGNNDCREQSNHRQQNSQQSGYQKKWNQQQQQRDLGSENKQISMCQKITLAYLLIEREIEKQAKTRAINYIEKYIPQYKQDNVIQMISEIYKVLLIPDQELSQLAKVLSKEERQFQLNQSLNRLNLQQNPHPLINMTEAKLRKYLSNY